MPVQWFHKCCLIRTLPGVLNRHILSVISLFVFLRILPCALNKLVLSVLPGALNRLSLSVTLPFILLPGALNGLVLSVTLPFILLPVSLNILSLSPFILLPGALNILSLSVTLLFILLCGLLLWDLENISCSYPHMIRLTKVAKIWIYWIMTVWQFKCGSGSWYSTVVEIAVCLKTTPN